MICEPGWLCWRWGRMLALATEFAKSRIYQGSPHPPADNLRWRCPGFQTQFRILQIKLTSWTQLTTWRSNVLKLKCQHCYASYIRRWLKHQKGLNTAQIHKIFGPSKKIARPFSSPAPLKWVMGWEIWLGRALLLSVYTPSRTYTHTFWYNKNTNIDTNEYTKPQQSNH